MKSKFAPGILRFFKAFAVVCKAQEVLFVEVMSKMESTSKNTRFLPAAEFTLENKMYYIWVVLRSQFNSHYRYFDIFSRGWGIPNQTFICHYDCEGGQPNLYPDFPSVYLFCLFTKKAYQKAEFVTDLEDPGISTIYMKKLPRSEPSVEKSPTHPRPPPKKIYLYMQISPKNGKDPSTSNHHNSREKIGFV